MVPLRLPVVGVPGAGPQGGYPRGGTHRRAQMSEARSQTIRVRQIANYKTTSMLSIHHNPTPYPPLGARASPAGLSRAPPMSMTLIHRDDYTNALFRCLTVRKHAHSITHKEDLHHPSSDTHSHTRTRTHTTHVYT